MSNLYELTREMEELMDAEDTDEQALARVFGDIQTKSESICRFMRVIESDITAFKAEEERLNARRKSMENKLASIKGYLKESMIRLGIDKIPAGTFKISLQNNSQPSLVIEDGAEIPADCKIVIPAHEEIDKGLVKIKLKAGEEIKGAYLVQDQHVRIR